MSVKDDNRWWRYAACGGQDPSWWVAEKRHLWPAAVRLCLSCPVSASCLEEAIARRDNGVIRAGMLLAETSRG